MEEKSKPVLFSSSPSFVLFAPLRLHFDLLVLSRLLLGVRLELDVLDLRLRLKAGDAQGLAGVHFTAQADLLALGQDVDNGVVVDPGLDAAGGDADADVVPLAQVEALEGLGE